MKKNYKKIIIIINIIGVLCLIYFAIPYLRHDMSIPNPNAMLASYSWDTSGFILTIGLIPLLIANFIAYKKINIKFKLLFFLPSLICLLIVGHYLIIATDWKEPELKEPITTLRCSINNKVYIYKIYEENNEYSLSMEDNDKLPLSIIDYTNEETIINSIEEYYRDKGGMCP